jgi:hypothetical protein
VAGLPAEDQPADAGFSRLVECFFAWITRNHRLANDVETTIATAETSSAPPLSSSLQDD